MDRLKAICRWLEAEGHMTPMGTRQVLKCAEAEFVASDASETLALAKLAGAEDLLNECVNLGYLLPPRLAIQIQDYLGE